MPHLKMRLPPCPLGERNCPALEFECGDGVCMDLRRRCDGNKDCDDGADEAGCDKTLI